jgi:hypothetical protein
MRCWEKRCASPYKREHFLEYRYPLLARPSPHYHSLQLDCTYEKMKSTLSVALLGLALILLQTTTAVPNPPLTESQTASLLKHQSLQSTHKTLREYLKEDRAQEAEQRILEANGRRMVVKKRPAIDPKSAFGKQFALHNHPAVDQRTAFDKQFAVHNHPNVKRVDGVRKSMEGWPQLKRKFRNLMPVNRA